MAFDARYANQLQQVLLFFSQLIGYGTILLKEYFLFGCRYDES